MLYLLLAGLIVVADQLLKIWAVQNLQGQGSVDMIPGLMNFYYAENTGAAFSMLKNMRWPLAAISAVAVAVIIYIILSKQVTSKWGLLPLGMVLGGAVGNLVDRVLHGYVVDMLEFSFVRFAIFNLADVFVTVGGALFCIYYIATEIALMRKSSSERAEPKNEN